MNIYVQIPMSEADTHSLRSLVSDETVHYRAVNPTPPDYDFTWDASSGFYQDHYQRERLTLIHTNEHLRRVKGWPAHGYSSWLMIEDV